MSVGQGDGGGGGGAPQGAPAAAPPGGAPAGDGAGQGQQTQPAQGAEGGLAEGFLSRVDPAHRSIVEPYIKQWDAGVTRRFQELHGQLSPYQELGDPEMLGQAAQLYKMIDENPQQVLQLLQEAIGEQGPPANEQGQEGQGTGQEDVPGLPPEVTQQLNTMQQVLEALAQRVLDQDSTEQQTQEDQQLDDYFGLLKDEFGEFDEDYVVAKMLAGSSGEEAVQAYLTTVQGQVNQRSRTPNVPPILGGGGQVPAGEQSIAKASSKDVKALVANILSQSQQG